MKLTKNFSFRISKAKILRIIAKFFAYVYLYVATIFIFAYFVHFVYKAIRYSEHTPESIEAWGFYILYFIINHLLIKKAVGVKRVVLFEGLLTLALVVVMPCLMLNRY